MLVCIHWRIHFGSFDAIHSACSNLEKTIDYCSVFIGLYNYSNNNNNNNNDNVEEEPKVFFLLFVSDLCASKQLCTQMFKSLHKNIYEKKQF